MKINKMHREKELIKNTFIISLGKICTQLITFFLLPLYTTILSTSEYGIFELLNTLVSLLLPVVSFQLEQSVFRNLVDNRDNDKEKTKTITTGSIVLMLQVIIFILIFLVLSLFVDNEYKFYLLFNVIIYVFSSFSLQLVRGLGNNIKFSFAGFISALVTIICNIIFLLLFKTGVIGMFFSLFIGQLVCILYCIFAMKIYKFIKFDHFDRKLLCQMYKYSIPLIPNAISWWVFNASDKLIVSIMLGVSQNGILSASYKFAGVYITIYNIFNIAWTECVIKHIDESDIDTFLNKTLNSLFKIFSSFGIIIIAVMPIVYPIMINSNFIDGYNHVPIMIVGSMFNILIGLISAVYVAKKATKSIALTSTIAAIINVSINLLLINKLGLYAASLSTLISFAAMSLFRIIDIRKKYFKINIDYKQIIYLFIMLTFILFIYYSNNLLLQIFGILISVIYAIVINVKNVIYFYEMFIVKKKKKNYI
ncbi:MAG: oligosaccharide flippase family protein [bacterium]